MDSGASMHMMSNLDISLEEQETITVSKTPTKAFTADAPTRTTDLAAVDVKELEMFVTVQLAKDCPTREGPSSYHIHLGKSWKNIGISLNGERKPMNLIKHGKIIHCTSGNFVTRSY